MMDLTACFRCLFLDAVKRRCPKCDALVKIGNVNGELTDVAVMHCYALPGFGFAEHPFQILGIAVFYRAGRYPWNVIGMLRFHSRDYLSNT